MMTIHWTIKEEEVGVESVHRNKDYFFDKGMFEERKKDDIVVYEKTRQMYQKKIKLICAHDQHLSRERSFRHGRRTSLRKYHRTMELFIRHRQMQFCSFNTGVVFVVLSLQQQQHNARR